MENSKHFQSCVSIISFLFLFVFVCLREHLKDVRNSDSVTLKILLLLLESRLCNAECFLSLLELNGEVDLMSVRRPPPYLGPKAPTLFGPDVHWVQWKTTEVLQLIVLFGLFCLIVLEINLDCASVLDPCKFSEL